MHRFLSGLAAAVLSFAAMGATHAETQAETQAATQAATPEVRLYRLDCGSMTLGDKSIMSDEGRYRGQSYDIVMSCYLIKHGKDWMLWDAGLPKKYLAGPLQEGSFTTALKRTIVQQLADLGLRPADIKYVAVSHAHFDHAGQVDDFPDATLVIQRAELDAIADGATAAQHYIDASLFSSHLGGGQRRRVRAIDGDVDLFGDGTVRTIHTPGHTPGAMALLVNLKKAGPYVLSGDQWHFTENHVHQQVPTFNYDHRQTIASGEKLDAVIARTHATLVIQHEPVDNGKLPKPPGFLD
jgi:N-acyl homoserine lactone hydrolase